MEILTKLTPAETYLINENVNCDFKSLLKYTMIDLLVKKVLKLEDVDHQSHPSNPIRIVTYVSVGLNFESYKPKPHELPFLVPFRKSPDLELMFRQMVKVSFENSGSKRSFIYDLLIKNGIIGKSLKNDFFKRLIGSISLTEEGLRHKANISNALKKLEIELPLLIEQTPKRASKILEQIKGNVFLLKTFDFELLKKVGGEYNREMKPTEFDDSISWSEYYVDYDFYSDSFDSGYSSVDGDSSGCSGASGCSGCSGCGGCGGCS